MPLNESALASSLNVSRTVYQALTTGLVSYVELDTVLSLEDALNIIEVDRVMKHNENLIKELQNAHS